ncbi:MAG TPA: response regulator, partial [Candidatus Methylomirabilis sp.]
MESRKNDGRQQAGGNGSARVLIAEDEPTSGELLAQLVEALGYETQTVADGAAAWEVAESAPRDLILSDVSMPKMDGFELCRLLKGSPKTRLIPVILITGIGEEHKQAGIEAGADDFLSKPFSL